MLLDSKQRNFLLNQALAYWEPCFGILQGYLNKHYTITIGEKFDN